MKIQLTYQKLCNRELMRIFRDLELVEHLGSGIHRILKAYDKDIFKISENFFEVCFTFENNTEVSDEIKRIIILLDTPQNKKTLKEKLGLKNDEHFRKKYLKPALESGFIAMTIPDKPRSKLQKYKLTKKAKMIKPYKRVNDEDTV